MNRLFTSGGQSIGASWTDDTEEFGQNVVPWRREWQTTAGFLLQEPHEHEQYEKSAMFQFKNKGHLQGKLVLASQGTREEGYTDPATATQDAMVTRTSAGGSYGGFVRQPRAAVLPGCPAAFQVLWEACQQRTGEHKTLLQLMLCNKSYQQLCLGNVLLLYSSSLIMQ